MKRWTNKGATAAGLWALVFSGCQKPEVVVEEEPPATPIPIVQPAATPTPPPTEVAEATPVPNYLAPPGVFFLVGRVSLESEEGIVGLAPGTRVEQIGEGEYKTATGAKLKLQPNQITNDLRVQRHVAGADAASQNALRQMQSSWTATPAPVAGSQPARAPTSPPASTAAAPVRSTAPPNAASSKLGTSSALGSTHTKIKDGFVWGQDANGNWYKIRSVR